jgi:hypothetical protein
MQEKSLDELISLLMEYRPRLVDLKAANIYIAMAVILNKDNPALISWNKRLGDKFNPYSYIKKMMPKAKPHIYVDKYTIPVTIERALEISENLLVYEIERSRNGNGTEVYGYNDDVIISAWFDTEGNCIRLSLNDRDPKSRIAHNSVKPLSQSNRQKYFPNLPVNTKEHDFEYWKKHHILITSFGSSYRDDFFSRFRSNQTGERNQKFYKMVNLYLGSVGYNKDQVLTNQLRKNKAQWRRHLEWHARMKRVDFDVPIVKELLKKIPQTRWGIVDDDKNYQHLEIVGKVNLAQGKKVLQQVCKGFNMLKVRDVAMQFDLNVRSVTWVSKQKTKLGYPRVEVICEDGNLIRVRTYPSKVKPDAFNYYGRINL